MNPIKSQDIDKDSIASTNNFWIESRTLNTKNVDLLMWHNYQTDDLFKMNSMFLNAFRKKIRISNSSNLHVDLIEDQKIVS